MPMGDAKRLSASGLSLRNYGLIVLHLVKKVFPSSVLP